MCDSHLNNGLGKCFQHMNLVQMIQLNLAAHARLLDYSAARASRAQFRSKMAWLPLCVLLTVRSPAKNASMTCALLVAQGHVKNALRLAVLVRVPYDPPFTPLSGVVSEKRSPFCAACGRVQLDTYCLDFLPTIVFADYARVVDLCGYRGLCKQLTTLLRMQSIRQVAVAPMPGSHAADARIAP